MGRTLENKQAIVADLKDSLSQAQMALVIDYKGLTVAEITALRKRLQDSNAICKVTKNTFMGIAISDDPQWQALSELLSGSSAFVLIKDDIGGAIKAYQEFQKASKKTELRGGILEGRLLKEEDVKAIASLPSKEQLMAQIAGALNAVTAKVAIGIKEVPASLARGIKAVSEQDAA
jgi:large subunit ribosomal protein L10